MIHPEGSNIHRAAVPTAPMITCAAIAAASVIGAVVGTAALLHRTLTATRDESRAYNDAVCKLLVGPDQR